MREFKPFHFLALTLWMVFPSAMSSLRGEEATMRLRLKDGSLSVGRIVTTETPHAVGWLSEGFERPFDFDARAVRSIGMIGSDNVAVAPVVGQCFELSDGGMICGQLKGIDAQWLTLESEILGLVRIDRSRVVSLIDASYAGDLVYAGPRDDKTWRPGQQVGDKPNWEFEAGTLVAKRQGAAIVGNVQLPRKAQIDLVLNWKGAPDFVFSFGTSTSAEATASIIPPAAARLEVWDKQLALLRDVESIADIELLAELLPTNPRLELTVYVDQDAGLVIVCDAHGKPLDRMSLPAKDPKYESGVQLVNHGAGLTLERFEVRQWDGVTTIGGAGSGVILNDDSPSVAGTIVGFDPQQNELEIQTADGLRRVLLNAVRRGDFGPTPASSASQSSNRPLPPTVAQPPQLGSTAAAALAEQAAAGEPAGREQAAAPDLEHADAPEPEQAAERDPEQAAEPAATGHKLAAEASSLFDTPDQPRVQPLEAAVDAVVVELVWSDRTRLRGQWLPSGEGRLTFQATGLERPVSFSADKVRGLIGTEERFPVDLTQQKNGTLKIGETQLAGYLEQTTPAGYNSALAWHPHGSLNASGISSQASGAVVYRASLPKRKPGQSTAEANPPQQDAIAGPVVNLFLGGNRPAPRAAANKRTSKAQADERELVFRSGDAIKGIIQRVDESGVLFESSETTTTFASHEQMQSVWMNNQRRDYEIAPEKLQRLMTVPRAMKNDPPTHLFVSIMGDYLRGRLVSADDAQLVVEVRTEIVSLPRDQIAQVIWLHDREWSNEKKAKSDADKAKATAAATESVSPGDNASADDNASAGDNASPGDNASAGDNATAELGGDAVSDSSKPFQIHAIKVTDRGLTFVPETVEAGVLRGDSELLGECSVELSDLNQLLFGRDISQQVRQYREDPWTLSLAQSPAVFDDEGPGAQVGGNNPMVGAAAPDFGLKTLSGDSFRLSESRDRVVILDFWASWCGPCVQTMPLVEAAVEEVGNDKVHLVAINIQETPERVKAAVERLGLDATVLLDRDGEVAAAYGANAIPQTVVIDREGNVTHVFVGGGAKIVEAIRAAIEQPASELRM